MRNAFASEITALAKKDERVVLVSGDIGNRLFDEFKIAAPGRFVNAGAAEGNMIGLAAGMALSGLRPVVYTINSFLTTRCYEQIRVDLCYHNLPVVLAGVGAGLSYASLGATHHSLEDVAALRVLPRMAVVCPGDPLEVRLALRAALQQEGPVFIRMGKKGEPPVHVEPPPFAIGRAIVVKPGNRICLLGNGHILSMVMKAADILEQKGVSTQVVSFHTVKPLDKEFLQDAFKRFQLVATVEDHGVLGGLGGSVAEWLADHPSPARLCRIGTPDEFLMETIDNESARHRCGLTPDSVAAKALAALAPETV
ncbi:MAG: transketolase [Elusimicrobia bacterium]|nr:transketolase [Elusimicrobiota bacterium]